MSYLGDFAPDAIIHCKFTTRRFSTGAPFTLAGSPELNVYKNNSTIEDNSGILLTVDFDGRTGLNHVDIDTSSNGTFYSVASNFQVVITAGTVDSISVAGEVIAEFSINNRPLLQILDGIITSSAFDAEAISAAVIAVDAVNKIADGVLDRDMSTGTDSGSTTVRTPRQALRFLRNKWSLSGTTLTVTKENDSTASWTSTITSTPGADPITANDPAGP